MRKKYSDILKSEEKIFNIVKNAHPDYKDAFNNISDYVISPVVFMYTCWIIQQAEKTGIKRIYFFSRDGYLMYRTAISICAKRNNGIECSYFYCSRYSLRMAAYWLKDDSAYDRLFYNAYRMSAAIMLQRAEFSENERKKVYADIGYCDNENMMMGRKEFAEFCDKVKHSEVFNDILYARSYTAYEKFCWYAKQEKITEYKDVAVVDLGWNGSIQYTLKKILNSMGCRTVLHGYYLGLLSVPPECAGNIYRCWVFGKYNKVIRSWFSHNLLECLCSAPHGMTTGYDYDEGTVSAVFSENENQPEPVKIIENTLGMFENINDTDYSKSYKKTALKLLYTLMVNPAYDEVVVLNRYSFCDDVAEQYHGTMAEKAQKSQLKKEILPFKLFYRNTSDGLYWYYGSVVASKYKTGGLYKFGYTLTRFIISGFK